MSIYTKIYLISVVITFILFVIVERRQSDLRLKDLLSLFSISLLPIITIIIYVISNYKDVIIISKKKDKEVSTLKSELKDCKTKIKEMDEMLKEFTK